MRESTCPFATESRPPQPGLRVVCEIGEVSETLTLSLARVIGREVDFNMWVLVGE